MKTLELMSAPCAGLSRRFAKPGPRSIALKAGVSAIALIASGMMPAVAQQAGSLVEVCCNGANGSTRYSSLVPTADITFGWSHPSRYPSEVVYPLYFIGPAGATSWSLFGSPTLINGGPGKDFSVEIDDTVYVSRSTAFPVFPPAGVSILFDGGRGGDGQGVEFLGVNLPGTAGGRGGDSTGSTVRGDVLAAGGGVHGIVLQANGGAGGSGGFAIGVVGLGGAGGRGGAGGTAHLSSWADVQTHGDRGFGLWISANGGAGGQGGFAAGFEGSAGAGGLGGPGGTVWLQTRNSNILTFGDYSHGILAEAIGGGGGASGIGVGLVGSTGAGGAGVDGGTVTLDLGSNIATHGTDSHAIFAQSVGGGGGSAGAAIGLVALGDDGGASGDGGSVDVTSSGLIFTAGRGSSGIFAQSVGGGGGAGSTTGGLVALGGSGGAGGFGARVEVDNRGQIVTIGNDSLGIVAQSIGGGGGFGGDSGGLVALGGDASSGGQGGNVVLQNSGDIFTAGRASIGLFAQSVGGGGGAGGASGGLVALGGEGDEASNGGSVSLTNSGFVGTFGDLASGIVVQSVGGAGGRGGSSGGLVALGGDGTDGGVGGDVSVTNSGAIVTRGSFAVGIVAESIGGGGGSGGDTGGLVALSGDASLGGQSTNSHGGAVTVTNSGRIRTGSPVLWYQLSGTSEQLDGRPLSYRNGAHGIMARSIGGGGGTGGSGGGLVALGGDGSSGGEGGHVTVFTSGSIGTAGYFSKGIFAESIGGGGGVGGSTGGLVALGGDGSTGSHGGNVSVSAISDGDTGVIVTYGPASEGILARSIGGGGGTGGDVGGLVAVAGDAGTDDPAVRLGGAGSGDAYGGVVNVETDFNFRTDGHFSSAIRAYSIGGGGGEAGDAGGLVALGGDGTNGGHGGNVTVSALGSIETDGFRSRGIWAESIGGGGGEGGVSGGLVALGGDGGEGSHGGDVTVSVGKPFNRSAPAQASCDRTFPDYCGSLFPDYSADLDPDGFIHTEGADSTAIFARSIGGGGGFGGEAGGLVAVAGDADLGGDRSRGAFGGSVSVYNWHALSTEGVGSHGIFAQSIGGGGGSGGDVGGLVSIGGDSSAAGYGGAVAVFNSGSISTIENNSRGIHAESLGGGGGEGGVAGGLVAIGGDGTIGGYGGVVRVFNLAPDPDVDRSITTRGLNSAAIYARSVGGGGGSGGEAGGLVAIGGDADDESVTIGGDGGFLNYGGRVIVYNNFRLETRESNSEGIFAQSIGGGGGFAGDAGGLVSLGGDGGFGGYGGTVEVVNYGAISTFGDHSSAIRAESLGGGGGEGGVSGGLVSLGGDGTIGGYGGDVTVRAETDRDLHIYTTGRFSHGIFARSIGGGGGDGGDSGGLISLGGDADNGPDDCRLASGCLNYGGDVRVENAFTITTENDYARGIHAESIGGGGGTAGDSGGLVSLGGDGGTSAYGGTVDVSTTGSIYTEGLRANGIFAQSIGGGGGTIFDSETDVDNSGEGGEGGVCGGLICLGGDGSAGGDGGDVTVVVGTIDPLTSRVVADSDNRIVTIGNDASAIFAQSIGGGGGDGGESGGIVSLGGDGGAAGRGGTVHVTNTFNLTTLGRDSDGIFARSIGGGGGTAGDSGGMVSLGGTDDAEGNDGGDVTVLNNGNILTGRDFSRGIYAESIGGGGGDGGVSGGLVSIGGDGSGGGHGGDVTVINGFDSLGGFDPLRERSIVTWGERSDAILARSIGGGGGTGGDNGGFISLGGDGGFETVGGASDGQGGNVTVNNAFNLVTLRNYSRGIYAQSQGGGGGDGGDAYAAFPFVAIALGGDGGTGATGGRVDVNNTGDITTYGFESTGLFAQSGGGSGGNGGVAYSGSIGAFVSVSIAIGGDGGQGGHGGEVDVYSDGAITTYGGRASGIFAESIGGGGGSGGRSVAFSAAAGDVGSLAASVSIGGEGGAAGDGGSVRVESDSNIWTRGFQSHGINAQSVGEGGGSGGSAISIAAAASGGPSLAASVAVGGDGGGGGDGGRVEVISRGWIHTGGLNAAADPAAQEGFDPDEDFDEFAAVGIFAQSVGGGGGEGGSALTGSLALAAGAVGVNVSLGGSGGVGGSGGTVTVTQSGYISTLDHFGSGILAQSVGGGGGRGGMATSAGLSIGKVGIQAGVNLGGDGGFGGEGGFVSVDMDGDFISTQGQFSTAIEAQSIGGGGGSGGQTMSGNVGLGFLPISLVNSIGGVGGAGNHGNGVSVRNSADLSTAGLFSHGILAQSVGGGGGNSGSATAFSFTGGKFGGSLSVTLGGDCPEPESDDETPVACSGGSSILLGDDALGASGNSISTRTGFDTAFNSFTTRTERAVVDVYNRASIVTDGVLSHGIFAQSVGGGGGSGGASYSGSMSISKASGNISIGLGGDGGFGGQAGAVFVDHEGHIETHQNFSNAILAQSVGGGGGSGGLSLNAAITVTAKGGGAMSVSLGGDGGAGGRGGDVQVIADDGEPIANDEGLTLAPAIMTRGHFSNGILAQSVGGGGGNGGLAGNLTIAAGSGEKNAGLGVTLGGDGAAGGTGGNVDVHMGEGRILTEGFASNAIFAQSVGGGGGNGGASVTGGVSIGKGTSAQIGVAMGGTGGTGNSGGFVSVRNEADLRTGSTLASRIAPGLGSGGTFWDDTGRITLSVTHDANAGSGSAYANGIFAQSVGGGGGNGGVSLTAALSGGGTGGGGINSAAVGVSLGGSAADTEDPGYTEATGGDVWVENSGSIFTRGYFSSGILAQSLGGGGGVGGWSGSFAGTVADDYSASGSLSLGGDGGIGNSAGEVRVLNSGSWIYTDGKEAHGIFASSQGGGGGNGGMALAGAFGKNEGLNLSLAFGGEGGFGGAGGRVEVENHSVILTDGNESSAIFAESRGGGGGNGGLSFAGAISMRDGQSFTFAFGGDGGIGNTGGSVTVRNSGLLMTRGNESHGIFAQSLGGGGGNGGTSITGGFVRTGDSKSINFGLSVGGTGVGSLNSGSAVGVTNSGIVVTNGEGSHGVFAQSIGGGGGNGGMAISAAVANTRAGNSRNLQATIGVGGSGGIGGIGGGVSIDHRGGIITTSNGSIGLFGQSVGGGGGTAGGANSISFQLGRVCENASTSPACPPKDQDRSRNYNVQVNYGGAGGSGNHAGIVEITSRDSIRTYGSMSHGILAQSVGGGGGAGGDATQGIGGLLPEEFCLGDTADQVTTFIAGEEQRACVDGEYVSIGIDSFLERYDSTGATNNKARQFMLDSIQNVSVGGAGGSSGHGARVKVENHSQITTSGNFSAGIIAHSVGGGGGLAGSGGAGAGIGVGGTGGASGNGGDVAVNNLSTAAIGTSGHRSVGIIAQSIGGGGGQASHAGTFLAQDQWPDDFVLNPGPGGGDCEGIVCVGGSGGSLGNGGWIDVSNAASISTMGQSAHGILAQTVGGGGGSFSMGVQQVWEDRSGAFGAGATGYVMAIGGRGGAGGDGGREGDCGPEQVCYSVDVDNSGAIETIGAFSHGILAQSIGGGGGNGGVQGDDEALTFTREGLIRSIAGDALNEIADYSTIGLIDLGGEGGRAGRGFHVRVNNSSTITTYGVGSYGILAQSIGGGGGEAAASFGAVTLGSRLLDATDILDETELGYYLEWLADAAAGIETSQGGNVDVVATSDSSIRIHGEGSTGILAQSVGGGGGLGGTSVDDFQLGGVSLARGSGGDVSASNEGAIVAVSGSVTIDGATYTSRSLNARGIQAQSIGGGGGSATSLRAARAALIDGRLGGQGQNGQGGGHGGTVTVMHSASGSILMSGSGAIGILAQSVGAGGGDFLSSTGQADVQIGGLDGVQGAGGFVSVESCGSIDLMADNSAAIVAQSVGGGGGLLTGDPESIASITLGGEQGSGDRVDPSSGGAVEVEQCGDISLFGDNTIGVFAQSVGGGGGASLASTGSRPLTLDYVDDGVGDGGQVTFTLDAESNIYASGDEVFGVVLQSIAGGGGWIDPARAGSAGGSGYGGGIEFAVNGDILATGLNSTAIFAQSEGGSGGGNITGAISGYVRGGGGSGVGLWLEGGSDNTITIGANGVLSALSGNAIRAGDGNDAIINNGVVVGAIDLGSGRNAFENAAGSTFVATGNIILRSAEDELVAGSAAAELNLAPAETKMPVSRGIDAVAEPYVFRNEPDAPADETTVATANSTGKNLAVQVMETLEPSVDGAGFANGVEQLDPAAAMRPHPAGVALTPQMSAGFDAQTAETPVDKQLTSPVMDHALEVSFDDSDEATASTGQPRSMGGAFNAGFMSSTTGRLLEFGRHGADRTGVLGSAARFLAPLRASEVEAGSFTNSGAFYMGLSANAMPIDLAAGETFADLAGFDSGAFNLLDQAQVINTVYVEGDFVQTSTGHIVFDAAFGPYGSDQIIVSGDAIVAGTGEVTLTWLENAEPIQLFSTGGVGVYDGLEIRDSAAIDYTVTTGDEGVFLNIETDFGVMFSGENGAALGAAMDAAVQAGEAQSLGRLLAMFGNMETPETTMTAAIGEQLNPEAHIAPMHMQLGVAQAAGRDVFACSADAVTSAEGGCAWARASQSDYDRDASSDAFSVSRRGLRFAGGFEQALGRNWSRSVTLSSEEHRDILIDSGRGFAEGQSLSLAAGIRNLDLNGFVVGTSLAAGWSWGDMQRQVSVFESGVARSEYQTGFLSAGADVSRRLGGEGGGLYLEPAIAISAIALRHEGLSETGLDGFGAAVVADEQWLVTAAPELSIGYHFANEAGRDSNLSLSLGARYATLDELNLPIRFEGTTGAAAPGTFGTSLEDVYTLSTRWNITQRDGFALELGYRAEVGDTVSSESAGFNMRWRF